MIINRRFNRVNGLGQLVNVHIHPYIPSEYFEMYPPHVVARPDNPINGKPWGDAQRDCYACSLVMSGVGDGCSCRAHGVMRTETVEAA